MPEECTSSAGRDLFLALDRGRAARAGGLRAGIEDALREAIGQGRLAVGAALPSTRTLAADLGVARRTVLAAYQQLAAEGYLDCRQGAPVRVAYSAPARPAATAPEHADTPRADLRPGHPAPSSFPRLAWTRAARQALRLAPDAAFGYGDVRGHRLLRETLAGYLGRARGVTTEPGNLLVCGGFRQALYLTCQVLRARGHTALAMEDPCSPNHRRIAESAGLAVCPVPCDGDGLRVDLLAGTPARAVLVTPAHQYPLGGTLAADRRTALVGWARERDGLVIEDDYDGEFRYDRHPVGALQPLDPDRVAYTGTTSKTLAPGLRLGWLAAPPALLDELVEHKGLVDRGTGVPDQLTLAELIGSGGFDRHLRRMRLSYRSRRDQLRDALAALDRPWRLTGIAAGLHALLPLPDGGPEEADLLVRAEERGVALAGLGRYWHRPADPHPRALVIGYGAPSDAAFRSCLRHLMNLVSDY
ncbi:MAG: PLP-dependent aminotransferase family protein [Mycobacteriales bacterium]